ncbi:MAG: putative dithiol-disulfide oxidoreductase (DUF899 family) [Planctomycetaceae bacterium]|jgi:predicted dithiol-disulfide oxidoreductase (DUF899 family)
MDIVDQETWLAARLELLAKEKTLSRLRDEVTVARQAMPWQRVEKDYVFSDERGNVALSDLFGEHSQLVIYHYMYGPGWEEGCRSCSFWADQYDAMISHLGARDVALAVVSRAPLQDFHVSFPGQKIGTHNFQQTGVMDEMPGVSVFVKGGQESIFHSYSAYSRGLDPLNATYQLLDLVPKGRDESSLPHPMSWVQLHDQYDGEK